MKNATKSMVGRTMAKKATAVVAAAAMIIASMPASADAAKKISLSPKKLEVKVGKSKKLQLKNNTKKVTWSVVSGKKCVSLKNKKKKSVTVVGKKAGKAKVQAKVGKKKYKCTVTVKAKKTDNNKTTSTNKPTEVPGETASGDDVTATGAPTDTATATETPTETATGTPVETPSQAPTEAPEVTSPASVPGDSGSTTPGDSGSTTPGGSGSITPGDSGATTPGETTQQPGGSAEATAEPTDAPTGTPESSATATEEPTDAPTGTPESSATATAEPTEEPTESQEPTPTPVIENGKMIVHYAGYGEYYGYAGEEYGDYDEENPEAAEALREQIADSEYPIHVIVDEGVRYLPDDAFTDYRFEGCSKITEIEIPASVINIGSETFKDCCLTNIQVAEGNTSYESRDDGNTLVKKNIKVKNVLKEKVPEGTEVQFNKDGSYGSPFETVQGCSLIKGNEKTTLTEDIVLIDDVAFAWCDGLKSLEISANVVRIGDRPFAHCKNLMELTVDEENPIYYSPKGSNAILSEKLNWDLNEIKDTEQMHYIAEDRVELVMGCAATVIPETVTSIDSAFQESELTSIEIPANVIAICGSVFWHSYNLTSVTFEKRTQPIRIEGYVFGGCRSLESIDLPDGLEYINGGTFKDCKALKHISIPDSVIGIEDSVYSDYDEDDDDELAFYGCSNLNEIVWGEETYTSVIDFMKAFTGPSEIETLHYNDDNADEIIEKIMEIEQYPDGGNRGGKRFKVIVDEGVTSIPDDFDIIQLKLVQTA